MRLWGSHQTGLEKDGLDVENGSCHWLSQMTYSTWYKSAEEKQFDCTVGKMITNQPHHKQSFRTISYSIAIYIVSLPRWSLLGEHNIIRTAC